MSAGNLVKAEADLQRSRARLIKNWNRIKELFPELTSNAPRSPGKGGNFHLKWAFAMHMPYLRAYVAALRNVPSGNRAMRQHALWKASHNAGLGQSVGADAQKSFFKDMKSILNDFCKEALRDHERSRGPATARMLGICIGEADLMGASEYPDVSRARKVFSEFVDKGIW